MRSTPVGLFQSLYRKEGEELIHFDKDNFKPYILHSWQPRGDGFIEHYFEVRIRGNGTIMYTRPHINTFYESCPMTGGLTFKQDEQGDLFLNLTSPVYVRGYDCDVLLTLEEDLEQLNEGFEKYKDSPLTSTPRKDVHGVGSNKKFLYVGGGYILVDVDDYTNLVHRPMIKGRPFERRR